MLADPLDVDLGSLDGLLYLLAVAQILVRCKAFQLQTQTQQGSFRWQHQGFGIFLVICVSAKRP